MSSPLSPRLRGLLALAGFGATSAIRASAPDAPLAWLLSARTAALPLLGELIELADARVALTQLAPLDRERLLEQRLDAVPDSLRAHVAETAERGNPLYLEHLADWIIEGGYQHPLPGTLHEAVLARLGALTDRAHRLTHWSYGETDRQRQLEALERQLGDWLDRQETSDFGDLRTIGRYLAQLRRVDGELVIARSLLGCRSPTTAGWLTASNGSPPRAATRCWATSPPSRKTAAKRRRRTRHGPRPIVLSVRCDWRTLSACSRLRASTRRGNGSCQTGAGISYWPSDVPSRHCSSTAAPRTTPTRPAICNGGSPGPRRSPADRWKRLRASSELRDAAGSTSMPLVRRGSILHVCAVRDRQH